MRTSEKKMATHIRYTKLPTNRNRNLLHNFLQENNKLCLNTHFQKRSVQFWAHASPNGFKSQIHFLILKNKWKNSVKNYRAYNSFISLESDHIIST